MLSARLKALFAATSLILLGFFGCGSEPTFDPTTRYSPESLARELAFRVKSLDRGAPPEGQPDAKEAPASKGVDATKKAPPQTLDAFLADTIEKAATIPDTTRSQACKKVAEAVAADASLPEGDKKVIVDRLNSVND